MKDIAVILSDIRSAHNVGSIFRTADCLGASQIFICGYTPYPRIKNDIRLPYIAEKVDNLIHKTALGAENTVPFKLFENTTEAIEYANKQGFLVAAIEQASGSIALNKFKTPKKIAIVLGNEVDGIEQNTLKMCDTVLEIPMLGKKESLNVSITSALVIYKLQFE